MDGFGHYYLSNDVGFTGGSAALGQKWDSSFFGGEMYPSIIAGEGRFEAGALRIRASGGQSWVQKNAPTAVDEMIVGFAFFPRATTFHTTLVRFNYSDAGSALLTLDMTTGTASVTTSGGATATSAAALLNSGAWQYIEFRIKVHATAGEIEVKLNETTIATSTAVDTGTTGVLISSLRLESTNNLQLDFIDDLYLLDTTGATNNTFLGDSRIAVLHPNGNGAVNNFTLFDDLTQSYSPITTNSDAVRNEGDRTIGRDHNYVESGLIGAREEYDNESMFNAGAIAVSAVHGVQVVNNTKKTATGTLKYRDEMTIAGVNFDKGTDQTANTGDYQMSLFIRDTDPSDSAAWTEAKVNAVGSGFVITEREI